MFQFPEVTAEAFLGFASSGRNRPALFSCRTVESPLTEYVVKFHGQLQGGCSRELIAATLGRALGIPVASGVVVHVDRQFASLGGDLCAALGEDPGPHFGSQHMNPEYQLFTGNYGIPAQLEAAAIDIFAWDMLIANSDRRRGNPNLLCNGRNFVAFDHELALGFDQMIGPPPDPWQLHGAPMATDHVFRFGLANKIEQTSFDSFISRLAVLSLNSIQQIVDALPATWQNRRLAEAVVGHFAAVLGNLDRFRAGLLGVF